jgi:hypothetical protein
MNKFYIMAHRSSKSIFGAARSLVRDIEGQLKEFTNETDAHFYASRLNGRVSGNANIWYTVAER